MLLAGIIFLLLIAAVGAVYLRYRGVRLAYIWIITIILISLVWTLLLVIPPAKISPFIFENWITIDSMPINLIFQINNTNFPISMSYISLLLAYLLSSITRLNGNNSLYKWVEMIVLIISGWVFLLAGDYWSILIGWTLIDFVELIFHFRHKGLNANRFYSHFLIKFLGSILLVYGISRFYHVNPMSLFDKKVVGTGWILPLAAVLHSGIFSNVAERFDTDVIQNQTIIFLRIIAFITSFFVLSYAPEPNLSIFMIFMMKLFLFGIATRELYKWSVFTDEVPGIQRILPGFGALMGLMFLNGAGASIGTWLILLLTPIGWLYLYTERDPKLQIFLFLTLFFISGLPFSITHEAFSQMVLQRRWTDLFFVTVPVVLVISGSINQGSKKSGDFNSLEPWYQVFYMIGLFLPLISLGAIVLQSPVFSLKDSWIGVLIIIFSVILYFFHFKSKKGIVDQSHNKQNDFLWAIKIISGFRFLINRAFFLLESLLSFFSNLFEGEAGILWSVVFLALFLTILKFQGGI